MHFLIEKNALKIALDRVRGVIPRISTIPILSNVLLEVKDGNLYITANDLDTEIIYFGADIKAYKQGATCVPGHIFTTAVNKLPGGAELEVELQDGILQCRAGRINFSLPTLPHGDFPRLTFDEPAYKFTSAAKDFLKALKHTGYSQSNEETRHYLNGIYINRTEAGLEFVATDGHRLARYILDQEIEADGDLPDIIVPTKAVTEFGRMLDKAGDTESVHFCGSEAKVRLSHGNVTITSRLIDGTYPDYKRIIPKKHDFTAIIDREVLKDAVDRVSTFTSDKTRTVVLFFAPDSVEIKANAAEVGRGHETVMIEYDGPEFYFGLNASYLLDHLGSFCGRDVCLYFDPQRPETSPILFTGEDDAHDAVLMGVKVSPRDY